MPNMSTESYTVEVKRIHPSSAAKMGFVSAIVVSIISLIMVSVSYFVLDRFGVISSLNETLNDLAKVSFDFWTILMAVAGLTILNLIFFPVIAALSAVVFNLCAGLARGLKVDVYDQSVVNGRSSSSR